MTISSNRLNAYDLICGKFYSIERASSLLGISHGNLCGFLEGKVNLPVKDLEGLRNSLGLSLPSFLRLVNRDYENVV